MTYSSRLFYYILVVQAQHKRFVTDVPESYPRSVRVVVDYYLQQEEWAVVLRWMQATRIMHKAIDNKEHGKNNLGCFYSNDQWVVRTGS